MENDDSSSKKVSRRTAIKDGVKIAGGLYFAAPIVFAEDCISCINSDPQTIFGWISEKVENLRYYLNGYYLNGYYSNGYYSNGYYSNGYYSNGYYSNGYFKGV